MGLKKISRNLYFDSEHIKHTATFTAIGVAIYLGAKLRLHGLAEKSIWYDEAFSILFARESFHRIINLCRNDVVPPLYFLLLHIWLKIFIPATSQSLLFYPRLFSAIFGILAIPLMYLLGKRLCSPAVGGLSAILLAFSPFHIYYSQEIRMYSLFFVLTLLLYIKTIDFANQPTTKNYLLLIFFGAVLLYVHYFAIFLLSGIIGLIFWRTTTINDAKRTSLKKNLCLNSPFFSASAFSTGVVLLFSPWLVPFLHHLQVTQLVIPPLPASASLSKVLNLLVIGILGYTPSTPLTHLHPLNIVLLGIVIFLIILLFFLGIFEIRRQQKQSYFIFIFLFIIPALLILLHIAMRGRFYERYFLPLLALFFVAVAQGVLIFRYRLAITLLLAILCIFFLSASTVYLRSDVRDVTHKAFQWLSTNARPDDLIIHYSPKSFLPFKCYDINRKFHQVIINSAEMNIFALNLISPDEIIELIPGSPSINKQRQLWLVFHIWHAGDTAPIFSQFLAQRFPPSDWQVISSQHFSFSVKHIYIVLLERL